jgi:hypothetical protein
VRLYELLKQQPKLFYQCILHWRSSYKLAIPKPKIRLTKVNDIPVSQAIEDLKSLARIKLSGEVTDENGNVLTNYSGDIATAIFDKNIARTTFNNDNNSPAINFTTLGKLFLEEMLQ